MGYSPITQGEAVQLTGPLQLDNGLPLPNLQNFSSAQLVFSPDDFAQPSADSRFAATGSVAVNTLASTYTYTPSSTDLINLKTGIWQIQCVVTYSGGAQRFSKPVVLQVNPPL